MCIKTMATTNHWLIKSILISLSTICMIGRANILVPSPGALHGPCTESSIASAPCQTLHSICVNNTCQCASPYSTRNGLCVFAPGEATVHNTCLANVDCYGQGEFCNYGYCRCLRTHVEIDRHCLQVIYPGQLGCDDNRQCSAAFPGSICRQRYCECPGGSAAVGQTCVPNGIGQEIESTSTPFHYEVETYTRRSVQSDQRAYGVRGVINYQAALAPGQPIQSTVASAVGFGTVPPGGVCSQDTECAGNPFAYCMSTCMCRDGAINAGSTCLEPGSTARGNCGTGQVYVSEAGACMNIARPGEPCQYSQQCSGTEVGAFCVNLRCRCVYGMVVTGDGRCTFINSNCTTRGTIWISELGECKPVIAPGARTCTHRQQCIASYPDSMCFLTQCTCPEGQPVAVDGTCAVQPGDRCQYSSQCHAIYPGMICDKGLCRCPNNQMWTGSACSASCPTGYMMNPKSGMCRPICRSTQIEYEGECLDLVGPEQSCHVSHQCQGGSTCINRMCMCPQGTQNLQGICSRASSPPGGPCNDGEYCVGSSYCENGVCTCPMGTVKANQQCVTPSNVPPNSPCGPTAQCSGNSVCINGACVCPEGQISVNGFCTIPPSVPPGYPCTVSDRCTLGSVCQNGICQCPTGTFLSENRCLVPMQVPPGAACRSGTELCTGLSFCVNNICACPAGMIPQGAMCRTPGLVSPGSSCANQERCGGGSECIGNVCVCPPGTKIVNLQCQFMASVPPNFSCANGEICIGGSQCQDGICRCPAGQAAFNQVCQYSAAGAGAPCVTNEQCTGGSSCISNVCTCRRGQIWSNGACVTASSVPPGSRCHELVYCSGGSRCISNVCRCRTGDVIRRNECVTIRVLAPGLRCSLSAIDQQCTGGSRCLNGTCTCPRGTVAYRDECINRRVSPLASCANGETCSGGSTCQNGVCTCAIGMVIRNNECAQATRVLPGGPCPTGTEVCSGGSTCTNGTCKCPQGQVPRDQFCAAPPLVPYNFLCFHDDECVGGASCMGGVCICPNSTLLVDGICQAPIMYNLQTTVIPSTSKFRSFVSVGAFCGNGQNCFGGAICERGLCVCPVSHVAVGNRCLKAIATVPPGGPCPNNDGCGGGSVCLAGVCVCPPTYAVVQGSCRPQPTVPPTASCANGERCGGGSQCVRNICTCPAEQVVIDQRCQDPPVVPYDRFASRRRPQLPNNRGKRGVIEWSEPLPKPGHPCAPTEKCLGGSICLEGLCQCPNGTSLLNERCIALQAAGRMANPGETCSPVDVCTGGSYCQGGLCVCPPGRGIQGFTCVTLVGPGFSCANAERCCGGSRCMNGVCACPAGMLISEDMIQCQPAVMINRANPGQPCDFGTICGGGSWCQNNLCTCPTGQIAQFHTCLGPVGVSVPPGSTCDMGQTACGGGSFCMDDQCNCGPGLVIQNQMCISPGSTNAAYPGQQCSFSTICTGGSICQRGFCACLPGQTVQNQMCNGAGGTGAQFAPPGGHCVLGVTTCTGGSFCSSGFCVCQAGQIVENQMCVFGTTDVTGLPPGSQCIPAQTICGGGSFCINNVCTCPQGQSVMNGICTGTGGQTALPGQPCDFATNCMGGSFCQNNRCSCPPGQMIINDACQSTGPSSIGPGGPCVTGITTCTGGSMCVNNMCTCPTGQIVQSHQCTPSFTTTFAPPGSWCNVTIRCTGGSVCSNNVCVCTVGHTVQNEICTPSSTTIPPGGSCTGSSVICGGGSYCNNGICVCPTGTFAQDGQCNRQPGNWAFPNQPCLPSVPCIGGSSCIGGICTCPPNQVVAHNECVPKQSTVLPGLACDANSICLGDSSCINGVCHCPPGQMAENGQCIMKQNAVPPGYSCTQGVSVCIGGSFCVEGRCACPNGQMIINDMCSGNAGSKIRDPQNPTEDGDNSTESRAPIAPAVPVSPVPISPREVPPGADCLADGTGCIGGSVCVNGKCVCGQSQIVVNGICTTNPVPVPPGSSCEGSNLCPSCRIVCGGGSTCIFGSCVCGAGQTVQNGQCVPGSSLIQTPSTFAGLQAVPGSRCDSSTTCTGGSTCKNGICTCPEGAIANSAMQCVPNFGTTSVSAGGTGGIELGAPCIAGHTPCAGSGVCRNNVCMCPENTMMQNGQCVQAMTPIASELIGAGSGFLPPGSPCNISSVAGQQGATVCGFGANCVPPGICTCPIGLKGVGGRCVPMSASGNLVPPGSPCTTGTSACSGNATCINGLCACADSDILHDGICVKGPLQGRDTGRTNAARVPASIPPGSPCPANAIPTPTVCSGGSLCVAEICTCPIGTSIINSICVGENGGALPGNPCNMAGIINCIGGSTCQNGICTCLNDQEPYGDKCVPKGKTVPPASACAENRACGGGSYCFNGLCTCPPAHMIQNGQCVPNDSSIPRKLRDMIEKSAPPGSWCGGAVVCNGGSYCYNNVCTCPFGQLIVNLQCAEAPIVPPGNSCLNGEVCGGGSVCAQGKCSCPSGTTLSGKSCRNVFMSARTQTCPLPENPSSCSLPDCYCSRNGTHVPGNFTSSEVPQMVVLTVDDALNGRTMSHIRRIFDGKFKNPNGCEVKATFFVSHEWNNYDEVQWLYHNGHEIAVNSITHQTISNEAVERWSAEMNGMRTIVQQLSGLPTDAIKGVRAPQLAPGGNNQFEMMHQDGFLYDNSMSANPGRDGPAFWPQTLDYQLPWRCEVEPCPNGTFPGIWVIPINQFFGNYIPEIEDHKRGAMLRAAMADTPEETVDTLYNMLMDNFNRVYRTNRAPYVITLDAAFFQTLPNNGSVEALERFLTEVRRNPDVWMVTERQVLEWMKRPTANNQISSFPQWQCNNNTERQENAPCRSPQRCTYQTQLPFGERSFKTCMSCPPNYPWLNNPTGTRRK